MFVCVRNAGRQERNIRDRLKIGKESKGEKETGKWRERKERINVTMRKWKKTVEHKDNRKRTEYANCLFIKYRCYGLIAPYSFSNT